MSRVERSRREKVTRYSVRKVSFGAASVAVAALFMFLGNGAVYAAEPNVTATDSALAATPANNQLDENSGASDSTAPKGQADTTTPAPADATPAPVVSSTTSAIEEKSAEKNTEASSAEANSVENKQQTTVKAEEPSTTSVATTKPAEETATTESSKPKVRKRRDAAPVPPATATDDDPDAHQTYEAPGDGASVDDLATKLKYLPETVENEKKLAKIDEIGSRTNIDQGKVSELNEFGGWKAVSAEGKEGKFAVARKTADGVFPIETVNVTRNRQSYTVHVEENSFDRSHEYILLLSQVRTYATRNEETFDKSDFKDIDQNGGHGEAKQISKGLKGFNGIEKTYKAYSSSTGTGVNISFKTGFTGDIDGYKAGYEVKVIAKLKDGSMRTIYQEEFRPDKRIDDMNKKVVSVNANDKVKFDVPRNSNPSTDSLNQQLVMYKNSQGTRTGTFTSKSIVLPKGATEYTVRIAASDNLRLGMGYQVPWKHYALPIVGTEFSVTQDTSKVAKDLSEKVYNKLNEQKAEDTKWSTPETKDAYEAKLQEIKDKLASEDSTTSNYKDVVRDALEKRKTLNEEQQIKGKAKEAVDAALAEKDKAIEANDKLTDAEKTAAKEEAKKAADEAKKAIEAATDQAGVDAKATEGTKAVEAVNPVGKAKAKAAVDAALAEKAKAIEANDKLTDAEKTAAKEEAKKAADEAKKAIDAATDQAGVDAKATEGTDAVAAVNPVGKDKAKAAVDAALAEKDKAIDANDKLSDAEKSAAKEEAKKAADEAKKAIDAIEKATTEADVEAAKEAGKAEIAKVAPATTDYKAKAKAEVEAELAKKLAELENATDLTEAEKAAAKAQVVNKAKEAIEAIQKAATEADVDQAIRNFVYRISAVIREQEEYDLSKLFVNGSVTVKQGESLTDKDVLSKLNLPSGVEIVKVEKPTTSALGTVMAKVTVKLADGSVEEINVPVEVIVSQNHGNEGNGANNGANNTEAKVNKAKLEGAIHQLDELIIKESAKLDAETAKEANDLLADAKKVFANADASQAEVDAMVKRIEDFMAKVAPLTDHANTANDQSAQTPAVVPANNQSAQTTVVAPATTQAAANASQILSAQANARKAAKELPNTGTADSTVAMVAAAASALLGLGLAGRRRKEDEEA